MKIIILIALLTVFNNSFAGNFDVLVGDWEQVERVGVEYNYTFLRINPDKTGFFTIVTGEDKPQITKYSAPQIKDIDGITEISLSKSNFVREKLIIDGFRSNVDKESGLITGVLYMYKRDKGAWSLFNTRFVTLTRIKNHTFAKNIMQFHSMLKEK